VIIFDQTKKKDVDFGGERHAVLTCIQRYIVLSIPAFQFEAGPPGSGMVPRGPSPLLQHFAESAVMYYYIFLHLEAADSQELFRADKNVCNYGFTPQSPISFAVRSKSKSS